MKRSLILMAAVAGCFIGVGAVGAVLSIFGDKPPLFILSGVAAVVSGVLGCILLARDPAPVLGDTRVADALSLRAAVERRAGRVEVADALDAAATSLGTTDPAAYR